MFLGCTAYAYKMYEPWLMKGEIAIKVPDSFCLQMFLINSFSPLNFILSKYSEH